MPVTLLPPSEKTKPRATERMAPLAKLPVFWSLEGRKVLIAGGSDAAAWKAELMLACGAEVHVVAPAVELEEGMRTLMAAHGVEEVGPLSMDASSLQIEGAPPSALPGISPSRGVIGTELVACPLEDVEAVGRTSSSDQRPLHLSRSPAPRASVYVEAGRIPKSISPLEGEMPGRAEGGKTVSGVNGKNPTRGRLIHHSTTWSAASFPTAALAIADCETETEAQAFFDAARAAGVPVNVIDKPAFCQFQFGSIVNRSPVIVSISTDGAAPILGQAIRRRIETLLPPALKDWAELAQTVRERANALLAPGGQRRAFWERFVDRAFAGNRSPEAGAEQAILEDAARIAVAPSSGTVTLVGAGPGDAELLTLKAVRALQSADVILFDDLVSGEVLELARREAKRMLVGKRGGRESCKQEDINDMMVSLAKAGKRVVRLKAGDPMIFGRAGEEIARLEKEGIPVDVVPGITAASAMASRLGISLTHRDHAQSVRFVTGHSRHGDLPANVDWQSLSDPSVTTVFYMGGRTAPKIRAALTSAGMPERTPVVIMTSVTRDNETRWTGTLDDLATAMAKIGVDQPVLIGIGNAFGVTSFRERNLEPSISLAG